MSRTLARRLLKLEALHRPHKPLRVIVRHQGCDWEDPEEPEEDFDENDPNTLLITVEYVDTPLPDYSMKPTSRR